MYLMASSGTAPGGPSGPSATSRYRLAHPSTYTCQNRQSELGITSDVTSNWLAKTLTASVVVYFARLIYVIIAVDSDSEITVSIETAWQWFAERQNHNI